MPTPPTPTATGAVWRLCVLNAVPARFLRLGHQYLSWCIFGHPCRSGRKQTSHMYTYGHVLCNKYVTYVTASEHCLFIMVWSFIRNSEVASIRNSRCHHQRSDWRALHFRSTLVLVTMCMIISTSRYIRLQLLTPRIHHQPSIRWIPFLY
jgi:hypothetical protein